MVAEHALCLLFFKEKTGLDCPDWQKHSSVNPHVHAHRRRELTWSKPDTKPPCEWHYRVMEDMQETDLVILFPQHKEHLAKDDMIKSLLKETDGLQQLYSTEHSTPEHYVNILCVLTYCVQHFNKFGKVVQPACVCHLVNKDSSVRYLSWHEFIQQIKALNLHIIRNSYCMMLVYFRWSYWTDNHHSKHPLFIFSSQ